MVIQPRQFQQRYTLLCCVSPLVSPTIAQVGQESENLRWLGGDDDERWVVLEGEKQGSGEVGEGCDADVCDDGIGGDASGGEIGAGGGECDAVDVEGVTVPLLPPRLARPVRGD